MEQYNIQLLTEIEDSFADEINKHAKLVEFKKGDLPFFEDELMKNFYIVVGGRIKAYQMNLDTLKEQTLYIYRRGDMLDTVILLDSKPHEMLYEALEKSTALKVPLQIAKEWLRTNETFKKNIFSYIAMQLRHSQELSSDLSLYDTYHRLVKLLLQNIDASNKSKYNILQNLSNSEISKLIGSVRHVVERHLKELKDENAIESGRKNISIKNLNKLLTKFNQMLLK